jgi:hypothetical protein
MQKLGWRVHFIEQIGEADDDDDAVRYFRQVMRDSASASDATLVADDGSLVTGSPPPQVGRVLLNISGHLRVPALLERCRRKVYIDIDPGYTQIWHEQGLARSAGTIFITRSASTSARRRVRSRPGGHRVAARAPAGCPGRLAGHAPAGGDEVHDRRRVARVVRLGDYRARPTGRRCTSSAR